MEITRLRDKFFEDIKQLGEGTSLSTQQTLAQETI